MLTNQNQVSEQVAQLQLEDNEINDVNWSKDYMYVFLRYLTD